MVVPITALALGNTSRGSEAALGLLLPLLILGDLISVGQYRKLFDFKLIKPLLIPAAVGIVIGSALLALIHGRDAATVGALIRLEIGLESVVLVGLYWYRQYGGDEHKLMREPLRSTIAGTYTGISTTLAHAAGPVVAMYLLPLKPERRTFVGSSALFFAMANTAKLPTYYFAHQFERIDPLLVLRFVPCVVAGAIVGAWLVRRMTDLSFLHFVYWVTFVMGLYLIVDGTRGLIALR